MIAVENVSTITEHPDYQHIRNAAAWAGFRCLWEDTSSLEEHVPASRPRWLALFRVQRGHDEELISYRWSALGKPTLANFDAWHLDLDEEHRQSLELTESAIAVYNDPRYVPESMKLKHRCSNISARAIRSSDRLGTIMASYSQQLFLGTHLAETQGIFAVLVLEAKHTGGKPHFLSPHQVLISHGLKEPATLPADVNQAFRHVGNFNAPAHALYVLGVAIVRHARRILNAPATDPMQYESAYLHRRIRATRARVVTRDGWSRVIVDTAENEISPTIPIDVTWVATVTTETQCYAVVLHQPTSVASIHDLLELPMRDREVFLADIRGPRRVSWQWEIRENCQVHIVAHRFADVGAARIAELRSCLHRVIPTTIRGEPSRFIVWMWDDSFFASSECLPMPCCLLWTVPVNCSR